MAPTVALFGTAMVGLSCSSHDNAHGTVISEQPKQSGIDCVDVSYIDLGPAVPYVVVDVENSSGEQVAPSRIKLHALGGGYDKMLNARDNRASVRIPRAITQIAVSAATGNEFDECGVIVYPYRELS